MSVTYRVKSHTCAHPIEPARAAFYIAVVQAWLYSFDIFYGNSNISSLSNSIASTRKVSVVISSFGTGSEKVNSGGASRLELYLSQVMSDR